MVYGWKVAKFYMENAQSRNLFSRDYAIHFVPGPSLSFSFSLPLSLSHFRCIRDEKQTAAGKLIGNGDWPFHVCCARADQRRKNIKGKRSRERERQIAEWGLGRKEERQGQFSCLIYFPRDNIKGTEEASDRSFCPPKIERT